jgi:hypothetical protein
MSKIAKSWPWKAALFAVVVLAVGLRLYGLEAPVLSHDEAFSWRLTEYDFGELSRRTGADVHPPLYYALLKAWTAIFGDSVLALRGLSVLFAVLALLTLYRLVIETLREEKQDAPDAVAKSGALFACLLLALAPAQIAAAQNARMYSLGVFLAALTAWLLLRAIRAEASYWLWWAAYGTTAGLFCYTHNYAFFTLFAQGLFLITWLCFSRKLTLKERGRVLAGFAYATLLAVILYFPWIAVLLEQIRQVKANYWIEPVNVSVVERVLFPWATGLPFQDEATFWIFSGLLVLAAVVVLWRRPQAGWFCLLQAGAPLVLSVGLSLISGRSIFLDHCLVFAQVALLAFLGVLWSALPGWPERGALGCLYVAMSVAGLTIYSEGRASAAPAVAQAAAWIHERVKPGDEVWTGSAWELNQFLFYLSRAGARDVKARCRQGPFPAEGHQVHIASLRAEDFLWDQGDIANHAERVWIVGTASPPGKMELVLEKTFFDGRMTILLALYRRNR